MALGEQNNQTNLKGAQRKAKTRQSTDLKTKISYKQLKCVIVVNFALMLIDTFINTMTGLSFEGLMSSG